MAIGSTSTSTHQTRALDAPGTGIELQENPASSGLQSKVTAGTSALSSTALAQQSATAATGVLPTSHVKEMSPAEVHARVSAFDIGTRIKNHFLPPAPQNVGEVLASYETAIKEVRDSRPVDEAKYDSFQNKRLEALQLESRAALMTRQLTLLTQALHNANSALNVADLPQNLVPLFNEGANLLPQAELKQMQSDMKDGVEKAWKDVDTAWDHALVDYLDAHQLDRGSLEAGFSRAGSPAYASRVAAPSIVSAATAIPSFFHPDTAGHRLALTGANAGITMLAAGAIQPFMLAATTLTSVTWSDRLFDHASDIQDLLGTKMIDEVDTQLQEVQTQAREALGKWNAVKEGDDTNLKKQAWHGVQEAVKNLEGANHEYLMRADLNRVYLQGFQNQGIANGLKYYGNLAVGPLSAILGSTKGAVIQLAIAGAQFAAHMAISPDDEKNKQLRMFYLRMRASAPKDGEDKAETLQRFGKEIRDPFKVAEGALQQVFTARVGELDTEISDTLKIKPNEWKLVVRLAEFELAGGEPGVFEGDMDRAQALKAQVETAKNALSQEQRAILDGKIALRNDTALDIRHVGASEFSKVSQHNQEEVYLGLQITPPSSGMIDGLKNLIAGPFSPEFRIGMTQGLARLKLPQEVMTTYGLAFWAAFQLGICGENGPLIFSKLAQVFLAVDSYRKSGKSPEPEATIALQSAFAALNLIVTGVLIYSSYRLLNIVLHPKGTREKIGPLAGGRSAEANTTYLGALLADRGPQRAARASDDPDAGFQRTGLAAGFGKELGATLFKRLTVLAKESIPAGGAREHFLEGVEMLDNLRTEIAKVDPDLADQMNTESAAVMENLEAIHGMSQEVPEAGPSGISAERVSEEQ